VNLKIRVAHVTHVGLVRSHNEDTVDVYEPAGNSGRGPLAIVADGLGGHAAGEVASRIAVDTVMDTYRHYPGPNVSEALAEGVRRAHRAILEMAGGDPKLQGMGTTCTVIAISAGRLHMAHVGDSRAYRLRRGLEQLTRDHTVAQELADESVIPPGGIESHPASHVLTRALGMSDALEVDVLDPPEDLQAGDRYLICSDGLSGQVTESDLFRTLASCEPEEACDRLVRLACNAGGPDTRQHLRRGAARRRELIPAPLNPTHTRPILPGLRSPHEIAIG
jgi:protein phosphatase